ncbi:aminotransferase class I/II-fold pyridoxal phosphate-dependent enzyme [Sandaracinobacter neustonicus]|uniref:Aminotransferase n=1 Tax=Sandaracinobacter neustonicus TaxID=1715348 RepID=A0A501XJW4_9SPHN|nr:pyridoxal phosphate-dependent aminotransferase [Sandaracinobacter neustonicus]TPE60988.1 aminotransferase class I/II-fold pyridoxal phosphate-dependent enzyme [Sandaracinobacter neustonicus]
MNRIANGRPAIPPQARQPVADLPASKIREIANAGFGRTDLLRFWFGESTRSTPEVIKQAAIAGIAADETFYTHNNGREDLREALSAYLARLHTARFDPGRVTVTSSGVSALMIAMQALLSLGDRVVMVTPIWPNVAQIPQLLGAEVTRIPVRSEAGGWALDLDELLAAITPATRLLVINSPGNPTGWTISREQQAALLQHCRRLGVWILADDVYERLLLGEGAGNAPSFLPIADPHDRLISSNSFSKAWLMTGWRLGWLVAPPELFTDLGKLIEINTSCAPGFIQSAGIAALAEGEPHVAALKADLTQNRNRLIAGLRAIGGVEAPSPEGGMYAFFRISGHPASVELARRLVAEAGLGLAPGAAFGPEGEGWLRWCFAAGQGALDEGLARLARWVSDRQAEEHS